MLCVVHLVHQLVACFAYITATINAIDARARTFAPEIVAATVSNLRRTVAAHSARLDLRAHRCEQRPGRGFYYK